MARPSMETAPLAEINMVPLIDVMLVLLVIFIVTAPLLTHTVNVELPQASSQAVPEQKHLGLLEISSTGELRWNEQPLSREQLPQALATLASSGPETELRIQADLRTPYGQLAQVMAIASRQGVPRIGFVSLPEDPE